ncbi:MAG: T9SS type A sorting domain-containing protein [Melioribacteraceae bacterium]|nr:T9SS type A sorting domain-containing protein [Melioribacteraceae bacterium]
MRKLISILFLLILPEGFINAQGNVYLIIGSDTAIWDGMNVAKYNCYYNYNVIPDNSRNYYEVMQPAYRDKFSDSYGNKVKLTWWLMCGNIFRYATNKNVPYPNLIVPYQSKKYYGERFDQFGDELSLHYHTFVWSDYDGDGKYFWNQAKEFHESKDDFYYTLAQLLIEENIFPVSFRSGWNHMCNEWQAELDKLLPYSMHNEAPAYRTSNTEPIDNVFDWRQASKEFVPYRPSPQNYQIDGNGKGWNLRSRYVGNVTQTEMNTIFTKAKTVDQVVCLWGHVWDDLFPEYVQRIDSLAKISANLHTTVKFKYTTGVEGMQLWRKINDFNSPKADMQEIISGDNIAYKVEVDKAIFQDQPFLAIKYMDESYHVVDFTKTGNNEWTSANTFIKKNIVKAGLAVTDTLGNLTTKIINYLPEDIYVDNKDAGYSELNGTWITETKAAWGLDSRKSFLQANDSSKARWAFEIKQSNNYNIFVQVPKIGQACKNIQFKIFANNQLREVVTFSNPIQQMDWVYLATHYFEPSPNNYIEMVAKGTGQESTLLSADVVKVTPLVRQKWLTTSSGLVNLGEVIKEDTTKFSIELSNRGIEGLNVRNISSRNNFISSSINLPFTIPKFSKIIIPVNFYSANLGSTIDTLIIQSDDPFNPIVPIAFIAEVTNYFKLIDNEEIDSYKEYGNWATSVTQIFGASSRYALLKQSPKAYALFTTLLREDGYYDISYIVPKTVNSANNALYVIKQANTRIDSLYVDQNSLSGNWVLLKNSFLTKNVPVQIKIADDGKSTVGDVLRTDAVKFSLSADPSSTGDLVEIPHEFYLFQNYPNPFNPETVISYQLPVSSYVTLKVYDILGREVATLIDEFKQAGRYNCELRTLPAGRQVANGELTSGIYFYRLSSGSFHQTKKMILLK